MAEYFVPYLRVFFREYQLNQKLVVVKMFQNLQLYDEQLFKDFTDDLNKKLKNAKDAKSFEQQINQICLTTHPISGKEIDRTYELLDVLNFHIAQSEKNPSKEGEVVDA